MRASFMTFACPTATFDEVLALAQRHGYEGIEFRCDADHAHGVVVEATPSARASFRRKLADAGISPCCLATSLQFVNPQAVEDAPARLQLAADIGCPALRVFCGPLPEGLDIGQAIPRVAHQLRQVLEQAQAMGVRLWLETHDSVSLGVHAGAIVRRVDHPLVAINWDIMHPYRNGEDLATTWAAIGPYVEHTHFHDAIAEPGAPVITPFGKGNLPIAEMHRLLVDSGYAGYYSGEWFAQQLGETPDASLAAYREGLRALE